MWQESFSYDVGGRLWRSTAGDGTVKLFMYDKNGNQTLQIASTGANLAGYTSLEAALDALTDEAPETIGTVALAGVGFTLTAYDLRNQATETSDLFRQINTTTTLYKLYTKRGYNAFGEVASETNARNFTTNFSYNTMGRLIQTLSPQVNWTDEDGGVATARPQQDYFYDLSGRLIGSQDANGNLTRRLLLAGTGHGGGATGGDALVLKEFRADGGIARSFYDAFGDRRKTDIQTGTSLYVNVETYVYDAMGRLTSQVHETRPGSGYGNAGTGALTLTDHYEYDGLGQRTKHWNSQLGSGVVETTSYDARGRVTSMVDMGGIATTYGYAWSATLETDGLGVFGGGIKTTTTASGQDMQEATDYFGRTIDKQDYGNRDYDYVFDIAGRLVTLTNSLTGTEQYQTGATEGRVDYEWYSSGKRCHVQ